MGNVNCVLASVVVFSLYYFDRNADTHRFMALKTKALKSLRFLPLHLGAP